MKLRWPILTLGFALMAWLGYWLAGTAAPQQVLGDKPPPPKLGPKRRVIVDEPAPKFRREERGPTFPHDDEAAEIGAQQGQRIVVFKDQAALETFLKRAGGKILLMGRLDALNALRVGFSDPADLASLLDGSEQASFIFPVDVPAPGDGKAQAGAVALGAG